MACAPSCCVLQLSDRVYPGAANPAHCGSVAGVLSRRVLVAGAAVGAATLAGCALVPPGPVPGSPTPSAAPATPDAAREAIQALHGALARAYADEGDPARLALLAWALEVSADHGLAAQLDLAPVPARTATPTPSPGGPTPGVAPTPSPAGAPGAALAALRAALAAAGPVYRNRALERATAQPLVWASMAAWTHSLAAGLDRPPLALGPRRDRLPPPVQTVADAAQDARTAAEQALYGTQVAGGAPGLTPDDLTRVRGRVVFWAQLRDDLRASVGPSPSPSPTPASGWFPVPRPSDAAGAAALVAQLQAAALPILGRSLAFGSDAVRARLSVAVADLAADQPSWGAPLERWPGWPA